MQIVSFALSHCRLCPHLLAGVSVKSYLHTSGPFQLLEWKWSRQVEMK